MGGHSWLTLLGGWVLVACGSSGRGELFGDGLSAGGKTADAGQVASGGAPNPGSGGTSAAGTSSAGTSSAGGAGEGGAVTDASPPAGAAGASTIADAAPPDASLPPAGTPTPGAVICEKSACRVDGFPQNRCCFGFPSLCLPACLNFSIASVVCDDASDCASGEVCCGSLNGAKQLTSTCSASCGSGGKFQICRTAAECGGKPCEPLPDAPDYGRCK